jgi:hypothetical protein
MRDFVCDRISMDYPTAGRVEMGRFLSPDDFGGHLEDPQTLNKYAYVGNNPFRKAMRRHDTYFPGIWFVVSLRS